MQRSSFLIVIVGIVALIIGGSHKAEGQIHLFPHIANGTHSMFKTAFMDDPPDLSNLCSTSTAGTVTNIRCCPPPGATGNCVTFTVHHPIEEDPPSTCNVWFIYESDFDGNYSGYDGQYIFEDMYVYDVDPLSLACE